MSTITASYDHFRTEYGCDFDFPEYNSDFNPASGDGIADLCTVLTEFVNDVDAMAYNFACCIGNGTPPEWLTVSLIGTKDGEDTIIARYEYWPEDFEREVLAMIAKEKENRA